MHPALEILKSRQLTLATAESCTGGQLAAALTAHSGASAYYHWGVVTYSNRAKTQLLQVSPDSLRQHGAVSQVVAEAMAIGALHQSGSQIAISTTGIAGPDGGSDEKPVGTVCFGLAYRVDEHNNAPIESRVRVHSYRERLNGDRAQIQAQAVMVALDLLQKHLTGLGPRDWVHGDRSGASLRWLIGAWLVSLLSENGEPNAIYC